MIKKFLTEEDHEEIFKKLTGSKQLKYFQICNDIENEEGEFVIAADISLEDCCCVTKMHYEDGIMIFDSSVAF